MDHVEDDPQHEREHSDDEQRSDQKRGVLVGQGAEEECAQAGRPRDPLQGAGDRETRGMLGT
jgi:hypothetical protein